MNRLDVILVIILTLFAARGFWRGFSREFFGFLGLIGGIAIAAATYAAAVQVVPGFVPVGVRPIVAFAAVFFAVDLAANLLGMLVHAALGFLFLSPINRVGGALFGAAKGAAMATIALLLVRAYTPLPGILDQLESSILAPPLLGLAGEIGQEVEPLGRGVLAPSLSEDR